MAERERLARVADGVRSVPRHVKQARRQRREREQIEAVVLEDRGERARVAGADELKIAAGISKPGMSPARRTPRICLSSAANEQPSPLA